MPSAMDALHLIAPPQIRRHEIERDRAERLLPPQPREDAKRGFSRPPSPDLQEREAEASTATARRSERQTRRPGEG